LDLGEINVMQNDEPSEYHSVAAYVYIGNHAFTLDEIWSGVELAEAAGIPLAQIGRALSQNWSATTTALALKNVAVLRALIGEASA
jgi:hypothetical protein